MMKQFVRTMFAAAAAVSLAACASTEDEVLENMIQEDIENYIGVYEDSVEVKASEYTSDAAKTVFEKIPAIQQQKKMKSLVCDMEAADGKFTARSMFAPDEKMKLVFRKDGKVILALIMNDKKVYRSEDGILYKKADGKLENALRFMYDTTMRFPEYAKEVSIDTFDSYKFAKDSRSVFAEPLEIVPANVPGDVRCYKLSVKFMTNTYNADLELYVSTDDNRNLVRIDSIPKAGLEKTAKKRTVINSRFFVKDGFVFPGLTNTGDAEMTVKNVTVNQDIPASEFAPDVLD